MPNWFGYVQVVASAALFGASSVIIKYTYSTGLSPLPVLIMQSLVSLVVAWSWVILSGSEVKIPASVLPRMVAQGAVGGFLTSVLFYTSLEVLGAALATLLLFTFPAFVAIYNMVCRGIKLGLAQKSALALALLGLIFCLNIFEVSLEPATRWAIILALGSAVTNAFLSINGEKLLAVFDTAALTAWSQTFSTLMMILVYQPIWLLDVSLSPRQAALVITGALMFIGPLAIYLSGMRRIGSGVASIISTAEIPFTLLLAAVFLQEALSGWQIFGGILITVSVMILYHYRIE